MTWTKTGVEFPAECAAVELSDAAYRTHHEVISWLYEVERSDCKIPKRRVTKVAESINADAAVRELVAHGWWIDQGEYYEVRHHGDVIRQSIAAQQGKRVRDKKAQQNHRKRAAGEAPVSADVSADVIPDTDRQTSKHLEVTESEDTKVIPEGCEHGRSWGCLECKRARDSA